jgi:DNA-binding transcriptional regulator YdaS (Cro superfamily)
MMGGMDILSSADAVIEAMGGASKAAACLGQKPNTVGNWKTRGRIPPEYFLAVTDALKASGRQVDPQVFGIKSAP